jgi:transcriptional regulator with PAS, ATPase and Fis domain
MIDICSSNTDSAPIITQDVAFLNILKIAQNIAESSATILIQGESGTGKELLSSFIHKHSKRKGAYIAVNCAALPESLAESELFGHEKGSFTGAYIKKHGKFEIASNGTIVLDEITDLNLFVQAKLLRVLQERKIDRIGGYESIPVNFRLIAISNIDLRQAVLEGRFREDLFYRVNVIPLTIPSLRDRKSDIPLLTDYFIDKYSELYKKQAIKISQKNLAGLMSHCWKGNVRELENAVERAVLLSDEEAILPIHLLNNANSEKKSDKPYIKSGMTIREMEKHLIASTLKDVNSNRSRAAEKLGISIRTLRNKLHEYKEKSEACNKFSVS